MRRRLDRPVDPGKHPGRWFTVSAGVPGWLQVANLVALPLTLFGLLWILAVGPWARFLPLPGLLLMAVCWPVTLLCLRGKRAWMRLQPGEIREARYLKRARTYRLDHLRGLVYDGTGASVLFDEGELRIDGWVDGGGRLVAWLNHRLGGADALGEAPLPQWIGLDEPVKFANIRTRRHYWLGLWTLCLCLIGFTALSLHWREQRLLPVYLFEVLVALAGLFVLLPSFRRSYCTEVVAGQEGLHLRRLAGAVDVSWHDVLGVQVTRLSVTIRTAFGDWRYPAKAPSARDLATLIHRVLALREQGHTLPGEVPAPDTALSRMAGIEPAVVERGISRSA